jgi:cytochrome c oxidase subunit 2
MSRPSVLSPASVQAAALSEVSWVLIVGASLIFLLVAVLLVLGLMRRGRGQGASSAVWLWGGGVAFPVVVLTALFFYGTLRTAGLDAGVANPDLVVSVTGRLWWWELRYRDPATGRELHSANELRIPQGRTVQIGLQSDDVVHSFWVPELGGKMDLVPGRVNRLVINATRAGTYRGQCAEFCGEQHARMALHVVVMPPAEFDAWLQAQAAAVAPSDAARGGQQAFTEQGCAVCHAVDPASTAPALGPNLAHVSSRSHLGAGVLRNDAGAYKRWLVGVQQLKPGAQMPSYARLDAATLDALSVYLESLR